MHLECVQAPVPGVSANSQDPAYTHAPALHCLLNNSFVPSEDASVQATRDYNIGESAEPSAVAAASSLGYDMPPGFAAQKFDYEKDTVAYDLILVMDKFTAGDVMREVS